MHGEQAEMRAGHLKAPKGYWSPLTTIPQKQLFVLTAHVSSVCKPSGGQQVFSLKKAWRWLQAPKQTSWYIQC